MTSELGISCEIDGLGRVVLLQQVHAGERFEVYRASHDDRLLAVKVPARASAAGGLFGAQRVELVSAVLRWHSETRRRVTAVDVRDVRDVRDEPLDPGRPRVSFGALLDAEAARIAESAGAWNHDVVARTTCVLSGRGSLPVLVTPWHAGHALGALEREDQRALLPRMMPALWDALAAAVHGDLHAGNVILAPTHDRFALIDPGAQVAYEASEWQGPYLAIEHLTFCTNEATYPLVPPYPVTAARLRDYGSLRDHWERYVESFSKGEFLRVRAPALRNEPTSADLMAIGVLYYQALCGRHPLYDDEFASPAWAGLEGLETHVEGADRVFARIDRGIAAPRSIDARVLPEEEDLALALLELEVHDKDRLVRLANAATAALHGGGGSHTHAADTPLRGAVTRC